MKPSWADVWWIEEVRNQFFCKRFFFYRETNVVTGDSYAVFPGGFKLPWE